MLESCFDQLHLELEAGECSNNTKKYHKSVYFPSGRSRLDGGDFQDYISDDEEVDRFLEELQNGHMSSIHEVSQAPQSESGTWDYTSVGDEELEMFIDELHENHNAHSHATSAGLAEGEELELEHIEDDSEYSSPRRSSPVSIDKGKQIASPSFSPPSPSMGYDICQQYYDSADYQRRINEDQPLQSIEYDIYQRATGRSSIDSGHVPSCSSDEEREQARHTITERRKLRSSTPSPPPSQYQSWKGKKRSIDGEFEEVSRKEQSPGKKVRVGGR
jgi:hypothetical protein